MKSRLAPRLAILLLIAALFGAMGWLTRVAWQTDRSQQLVEHSALRDKNISIALWRLDSLLAPILARQATLPAQDFQLRNASFDSPNAFEVTSEPYILFRFHWPSGFSKTETLLGQSKATERTQSSLGPLFQSLFERTTWQELATQLPRDLVPRSPELLAEYERLNITSNADQIVSNSLYEGNGKMESKPGNNDLMQRNLSYQNQGAQQIRNQSQQAMPQTSSGTNTIVPKIAICKPLWVADWLLMARQISIGEQQSIQGSRIDWFKLREELLPEIHDLLPHADLVSVVNDSEHVEFMLAGLPARLDLPPLELASFRWSPLIIAIASGWVALLMMTSGLMTISFGAIHYAEKRSSFVSSVTHELRTPLTTFQMYSDMLSRGVVSQESRQEYLDTLCIESNRLCNLIDNVLTYSRLEQSHKSRGLESITVGSLVDHFSNRMVRRAELVAMQFETYVSKEDRELSIQTDPAMVEQILFNLIDNACKYAQTGDDRRIALSISRQKAWLYFRVIDHGPGIDRAQQRTLFRPFSKSSEQSAASQPGVGLGLALSYRLAKQLGGSLSHDRQAAGCQMILKLPIA